MINLSDKAVNKLISLRDSDDKILRIGVAGGGCSGLAYKLTWITTAEIIPSDHSLSSNNLNYVIDAKSALFLKGTDIDYIDGLNGSGFAFTNPNSKASCGCGQSFR